MGVILKVMHLGSTWEHADEIFMTYVYGKSKNLL